MFEPNVPKMFFEFDDFGSEDPDLAATNPMYWYLHEFFANPAHPKSNDVSVYRNYVQQLGPSINISNKVKCNFHASVTRQVGNRLFQEKRFRAALEKYNESICWAKADSEELALGYANRSAIYYEQKEYEIALFNITLARKHRYPAKLLPKLLTREFNCKKNIANDCRDNSTYPELDFTIKTNNKRPSVAQDIQIKQIPKYGRGMVANRAFQVGEVILCEQPIMSSIDTQVKFLNCDFCSSTHFHSLIPCPNCGSVMFCNEECLEKGLKFIHRFECGIAEKLHHIRTDHYLGIRMFFYGLSLFEDNIEEMMKFCKSHPKSSETNPFKIDFTTADRLKQFELFHKVQDKNRYELNDEIVFRFLAALYYEVYLTHPTVKSIFAKQCHKNFMLHSFLDYIRTAAFMKIGPGQHYTEQLFLFAALCNHSCDPNTLSLHTENQLKFIVLRPIAENDEILISYGPLCWDHSADKRHSILRNMYFKCRCDVCVPTDGKFAFNIIKSVLEHPTLPSIDIFLFAPYVTLKEKLHGLQRYIEYFASIAHPNDELYEAIDAYGYNLRLAFKEDLGTKLRKTMIS
ncbi:SET and MYND domain-containing protein 4-like [Malaya genurostris]|uniref:SET and MYND domain-containing protein 4-like n=1 Tax=Malaya genurostris TaxID=325434 RepID=UPI0026F3EDA7|nr:SET and MYND domain-containing protein 4-like [Malaya genurostris]